MSETPAKTSSEETLAATRERHAQFFEGALDIVLFIDPTPPCRIVHGNPAAVAAYGYSLDELTALHVNDLRDEPIVDGGAVLQQTLRSGLFFETVHRRKDGSTFAAQVSCHAIDVDGRRELMSVVRDVSERRALHTKLLESDRLSTFGMMAAGIAHEINNPLAYVMANTEVMSRALPRLAGTLRRTPSASDVDQVAREIAQCEEMLRVVSEGIDRVRTIVRDLKAFSRSEPERGGLVDLHHTLDSSLNIARSELRHRARVVRSYGDIGPVRGSTTRLGQVFLNLIINGAHAIGAARRGGGELRVQTAVCADGWTAVSITDNGTGIAEGTKQRLFEPFYTTKVGEGTGLGLYISRCIVEEHGGRIEVDSTQGEGTTVQVLFPPYDPRRELPQKRRPPQVESRMRVLIVDDEPAIGASFRAVLAPTHDVVCETRAVAAAERLQRGERFDAILCDVMLPERSGVDFVEGLRRERPLEAARVVFMTGGILDGDTRTRLAETGLPMLDKPISRDELLAAIEGAARRAPAPL